MEHSNLYQIQAATMSEGSGGKIAHTGFVASSVIGLVSMLIFGAIPAPLNDVVAKDIKGLTDFHYPVSQLDGMGFYGVDGLHARGEKDKLATFSGVPDLYVDKTWGKCDGMSEYLSTVRCANEVKKAQYDADNMPDVRKTTAPTVTTTTTTPGGRLARAVERTTAASRVARNGDSEADKHPSSLPTSSPSPAPTLTASDKIYGQLEETIKTLAPSRPPTESPTKQGGSSDSEPGRRKKRSNARDARDEQDEVDAVIKNVNNRLDFQFQTDATDLSCKLWNAIDQSPYGYELASIGLRVTKFDELCLPGNGSIAIDQKDNVVHDVFNYGLNNLFISYGTSNLMGGSLQKLPCQSKESVHQEYIAVFYGLMDPGNINIDTLRSMESLEEFVPELTEVMVTVKDFDIKKVEADGKLTDACKDSCPDRPLENDCFITEFSDWITVLESSAVGNSKCKEFDHASWKKVYSYDTECHHLRGEFWSAFALGVLALIMGSVSTWYAESSWAQPVKYITVALQLTSAVLLTLMIDVYHSVVTGVHDVDASLEMTGAPIYHLMIAPVVFMWVAFVASILDISSVNSMFSKFAGGKEGLMSSMF